MVFDSYFGWANTAANNKIFRITYIQNLRSESKNGILMCIGNIIQ